MQIYNLFWYQQTREGYFCRVFWNCRIVYQLQRLDVFAAIILHATPSLECVKGKLHRHYRIVNIITVVHLAMDVDILYLLQVIFLKLRHHLLRYQLLRLHTGSPMLWCVESVEAWNLAHDNLVNQLSGIRYPHWMAKCRSILAISPSSSCSLYFACWRAWYVASQLDISVAHSSRIKSIFLRLAGLV